MENCVVLKTILNQYGERVDEEILCFDLKNGEINLEVLACYSAISLGLGTCRCVHHDTYEKYPLSPQGAEKLLRDSYEKGIIDSKTYQKGVSLVEKVKEIRKNKEEYYRENPLDYLLDYYGFKTVEELENALENAYLLGLNPLPALRKALKQGGLNEWKVVYVYDPEDQVCELGYENSIIVKDRTEEGEKPNIFIAVSPYKPEEKEKSQKKRRIRP